MNKDFFVIAHNIRSLYNVGSIFRTADAFGATKIYLTGYTGAPQNPVQQKRIAKSALGAEKWMPWEYKKSAARLIKDLKLKKVNIIALENNVKALSLSKFKPKPILKLCDKTLEIPMLGKKESLNVSVAFGIAAYKIIEQNLLLGKISAKGGSAFGGK
jgi:tRNA G18 (ribose-2'-O)-methylase SpoU